MIKNVVEREVWFFKYRYIIFSRMLCLGGRGKKVIYMLRDSQFKEVKKYEKEKKITLTKQEMIKCPSSGQQTKDQKANLISEENALWVSGDVRWLQVKDDDKNDIFVPAKFVSRSKKKLETNN